MPLICQSNQLPFSQKRVLLGVTVEYNPGIYETYLPAQIQLLGPTNTYDILDEPSCHSVQDISPGHNIHLDLSFQGTYNT
ncbi:MAG: hypothetical protein MUP82_07425 [Candidatus Marinimicrobia bacterium]|nr:hypothetical protein [Candidatus Neomarinimicrobiota bacterium]